MEFRLLYEEYLNQDNNNLQEKFINDLKNTCLGLSIIFIFQITLMYIYYLFIK